jgi:uncharacterized protein
MPPILNSELFLIPDRSSYLVYAPLRGCVMRLAPENVNVLVRIQKGDCGEAETKTEFFQCLVNNGIIDGSPEVPPVSSTGRGYAPVRTTLLLTTRCNLACRYCYAAGREPGLVMSEQVGRAALDYVAANCKQRGLKKLEVGFHGGGEPTMAWKELTALAIYAKEVALRNELELRLGLATNGCFSEAKARWIASHFANVNISLDGPPRIQDAMRPRKGGGRSSSIISNALRVFDECKTPYAFQSTITRETAREMPAIVGYVARHTRPQMLKFEPVSDCGRFCGQGDQIPCGQEFAQFFNQAYEVGRSLRLPVAFSGVRLLGGKLSCFCGAFAEPFAVTPEGFVSACYEAFSCASSYADMFLFGRWDDSSNRFSIDHDKLERLRSRSVYNLEPCSRCFCKYSCAGDCPTRNFRYFHREDLFTVGARCDAIREITRYQLSEMINGAHAQPNPQRLRDDYYEKEECG